MHNNYRQQQQLQLTATGLAQASKQTSAQCWATSHQLPATNYSAKSPVSQTTNQPTRQPVCPSVGGIAATPMRQAAKQPVSRSLSHLRSIEKIRWSEKTINLHKDTWRHTYIHTSAVALLFVVARKHTYIRTLFLEQIIKMKWCSKREAAKQPSNQMWQHYTAHFLQRSIKCWDLLVSLAKSCCYCCCWTFSNVARKYRLVFRKCL